MKETLRNLNMELMNCLMINKDVVKAIVEYNNNPIIKELKSHYRTKSFLEILSSNKDERTHNSFLSWFFNPNSEHGLFFFPIKKLLELYAIRCSEICKYSIEMDFFNALITGAFDVLVVSKVNKEKSIGIGGMPDIHIEMRISYHYKKDDRNIVVEKDVNVIIENKVESKEHNNQTTNYHKHFDQIKESVNLYFYLNPISTIELNKLQKSECSSENFIQINYQQLVDYIFEPALNHDISERVRFIINEYLKSLSKPIKLNCNLKRTTTMAVTNNERELLIKFWEQNEDLIKRAMNAIVEDVHQAEEVRESVEEALIALTTEKVGAYVRRTLKEMFANNSISQEEVEKMQTAEYSRNTFHILHPLLIEADINRVAPIHYWKDRITIGSVNYFMCCEWFEQPNNNDRVHFDKWLISKN